MNPLSSIAGRIKQYLAGIVYRHYAKPSVIRHYRCSTLPSTLERVAKKPCINVVFLAMSPDIS